MPPILSIIFPPQPQISFFLSSPGSYQPARHSHRHPARHHTRAGVVCTYIRAHIESLQTRILLLAAVPPFLTSSPLNRLSVFVRCVSVHRRPFPSYDVAPYICPTFSTALYTGWRGVARCSAMHRGGRWGRGVQAALSILRCMRNYLHPGLAALRESRPASLPTPFLKLSSPAPSCLSHFLVVPPSVAVSASFSALLFCLHNQKERKAPVTIQQNTRLLLVRPPLDLSAILPPAPTVPQTLLSQLPRYPLHPDSGWCSADPRGRGEPRNAPLNLTSTRWR